MNYGSRYFYMRDEDSARAGNKVKKTLNVFALYFVKWHTTWKKLQLGYIFGLKVLFCCVAFKLTRKLKYQGTHAEASSVKSFFFFFLFGVHTCDSRGRGVGVKLVKRMAERLRQQMDNKGDGGGLSLRPDLPFILVISPVRLGRGCSGIPHKGFSITLREHLFPKPFMFICTSAA